MPFISGHAMFNPITPGGEQALIPEQEIPHGRNTNVIRVNITISNIPERFRSPSNSYGNFILNVSQDPYYVNWYTIYRV